MASKAITYITIRKWDGDDSTVCEKAYKVLGDFEE
jgi:hypothetical protein